NHRPATGAAIGSGEGGLLKFTKRTQRIERFQVLTPFSRDKTRVKFKRNRAKSNIPDQRAVIPEFVANSYTANGPG
ncbi:MAG TPA: hypothetical protein VIX12_08860, partial [Candidatus Binataceae bacterium]